MKVADFVRDYSLRHDASEPYQDQLRWAMDAFSRHLGREALLSDLTETSINQWLYEMKQQGYSSDTRRNRRRYAVSLALDAARCGLIPAINRDMVAKVKAAPRMPKGLSWEQALHVQRCIEVRGGQHQKWLAHRYRKIGIIRRDWWRAYLSCCWDTGAPADLRELEFGDIRDDGRVFRLRRKTGKPLRWLLSPVSLAAIDRIHKPIRDRVFPLSSDEHQMRRDARKILQEIAGLDGMTLGGYRSGAGTDAELIHGAGAGCELLGNTQAVFRKHYEISPLLDRPVRAPRPLMEGN